MTLAPRDYITERRREISQRMEQLKLELIALDRMESALDDGPLMSAAPMMGAYPPQAPTIPKRRRITGGIKGLILDVLASAANGMTAQKIIEAIKLVHGAEIPRTSISPQLSRLKKDDKVSVDGSTWKITLKGLADAL